MRNRKRPNLSAQSTNDFLDTATATATTSSVGHSINLLPNVSISEKYISGRGDIASRLMSFSDLLYYFKKNLKRAVIAEKTTY